MTKLRITVQYEVDEDFKSLDCSLEDYGDYIKDEGHALLGENATLITCTVEDVT